MRFFCVILAVLAVVLGGCMTERPRCEVYHFQSSYPAEYRGAAYIAAARWSAWSGRPITISDVPDDSPVCGLMGVYTEEEHKREAREMGDTSWAARHREADGNIALAPFTWTWDECVQDMQGCAVYDLMHEFGHEYGLQHTDGHDDVMGVTNPSPRLHFSDGDAAEFHRVTGGPPARSAPVP